MSQADGKEGLWIVVFFMFLLILFLLPANLFWYVMTLVGVREPYFNGIVEALVCPWDTGRAFHPLSWGPFLFDCVFSGVAWLMILKIFGVKL